MKDLVDLETLQGKIPLWKKSWSEGIGQVVEEANLSSEKARRRLGLRGMLEEVRDQESELSGQRVEAGAKLVEWLIVVVMFLLGIGVVRGLLTTFPTQTGGAGDYENSRGFNVWILLMVTIGLQAVVLLVGAVGFVFWKKWAGHLGGIQGWLSRGIGTLTGGVDLKMKNLTLSVWSWRLTRILQSGSVGYNLGLLAGLFGCLWFLQLSFFWETSLPQFGENSLYQVTHTLSLPVGGELVDMDVIRQTNLNGESVSSQESPELQIHSLSPTMRADLAWSGFFFVVLTVWGLGPRLVLWMASWWMERRALAGLEFQEASLRRLWRDVTRIERGEVSSQPADGVVVLDIGGIEMKTETMRPYFLQVLRTNPEARFLLGTLDEKLETEAMEAAKNAALGVVFLVEGWNLSPKQMNLYHLRVRDAIGENHPIRYLMVGSVDELSQWAEFVDGLNDSETEIFRYESS